MVVWVPATFRQAELVELLNMVLPVSNAALSQTFVAALASLSPLLAVLVVIDQLGPPRESINTMLRVAAFFLLFAVVPPLWSFGLYFCGWHSIRGLIHLQEQTGYSTGALFRNLVPVSVAAVLLLACGLIYWSSFEALTPAVVRTLFVGLSALAVPHLLLHVAIDLRLPSQAAMTQPLATGSYSEGAS